MISRRETGELIINTSVHRNIIHGSDKVETAKREIALWFTEAEQTAWEPSLEKWIYE